MIAFLAQVAGFDVDVKHVLAALLVAAAARYGPELLHRIEAKLRASGHAEIAGDLELVEAAFAGVHDAHGPDGLAQAAAAAKEAAPHRAEQLEGAAIRVLEAKKEA